MNWADFVIVGLLTVSALISLLRGFIREALSLVFWILAFGVAFTYAGDVALRLPRFIEVDALRTVVAFTLLFLATFLVTGLAGYAINRVSKHNGLSGTDRFLGLLFGLARGVVVVTVVVVLLDLTPLSGEEWYTHSVLVSYFQDLGGWLHQFLPARLADVIG